MSLFFAVNPSSEKIGRSVGFLAADGKTDEKFESGLTEKQLRELADDLGATSLLYEHGAAINGLAPTSSYRATLVARMALLKGYLKKIYSLYETQYSELVEAGLSLKSSKKRAFEAAARQWRVYCSLVDSKHPVDPSEKALSKARGAERSAEDS